MTNCKQYERIAIDRQFLFDKYFGSYKNHTPENHFRYNVDHQVSIKYGVNPPEELLEIARHETEKIINAGAMEDFSFYQDVAGILTENQSSFYSPGVSNSTAFIEYLFGMTKVNPLRPHVYCKKCKHLEFLAGYESGYDAPDMVCPICGDILKPDGHNIIPLEDPEGTLRLSSWNLRVSEHALDEIIFHLKEYYNYTKNGCSGNSVADDCAQNNGLVRVNIGTSEEFDLMDYVREKYDLMDKKFDEYNSPKLYDLYKSPWMPMYAKSLYVAGQLDCDIIPKNFTELVHAEGHYPGRGLWENNGVNIYKSGILDDWNKIPASREDLIKTFYELGMYKEEFLHFGFMIGKGGARFNKKEFLRMAKSNNLPQWLTMYCTSFDLPHMWPRRSCIALAIRDAEYLWYLWNYPKEFNQAAVLMNISGDMAED